MVQVPGFKDKEARQLLFGLRVGTIRDHHLPVLESKCRGVLGALETFSPNNVAVFPKHLVVRKELVHRSLPLAFRHGFPVYRPQVGETDVFHIVRSHLWRSTWFKIDNSDDEKLWTPPPP